MENPLYHVLLQGRRVGPYDRRTIVGMRIKKALASADVVVAGNGRQLTVADLVKMRPDDPFEPSRSGSYSVIQAVYTAALADSAGPGMTLPVFKGEIEVRVQTKALRLAGRFRERLRWKEDRVKIALEELVYARVRGSLVDIGMRSRAAGPLQRVTLELFTAESAAEFITALPPLPNAPELVQSKVRRGPNPMAWMAVAGSLVAVGGVLVWVLTR
ncbi:hypothetical protein HHL11_20195 [Ramlibacter sp. G-1-2-2]|uniref:Uncharacterized protein n=1 Tax=Ramlibacter agri TaxID=2728837 RepID=A0A848H996_9BURK|nr:hypothetical protein [Ramlibacter agri]NML46079.1 hypothetical protein [Ramlibacter agri]